MNRDNKPTYDPRENLDYVGGPAFHPALPELQTPKKSALPPSISVPLPDNDDEEQREMLFDGTAVLSPDLYSKTEMADAMPDMENLRAARKTN